MFRIMGASLAAAASIAAVPATAQSSWTGFHIGGRAGVTDADASTERVAFDTDLDGDFDDSVRTIAGADAFSPGFCEGAAFGRTPAEGCRKDKEKGDYALTAGYDQQFGSLVVGIVGEIGRTSARDSVTAFSTTPAFYTMTRQVRGNAAVRARLGMALGNTLPYLTAGIASAKVRHSFATSNGVNSFPERKADDKVLGVRFGGGVEQRFGPLAVGLLYLGNRYEDDDYRVRATGPAPVTNPFILANPNGTDFRRSDGKFLTHSLNLTFSYRL